MEKPVTSQGGCRKKHNRFQDICVFRLIMESSLEAATTCYSRKRKQMSCWSDVAQLQNVHTSQLFWNCNCGLICDFTSIFTVMGVNIDLVTRRAKLNLLRQKIRHCSLCNFQITLFHMNSFKWIFHPNCRVHLATATTRAATTTQKPLGLMSDQMLAYIVQPTWWCGGPAPPDWEALPPHPAVHIPAYMFPRWWHHISFLCCWHIIPSSTEPSVVLRSDHCCCIFFF